VAGTAVPGVNYLTVSNVISFSDGQTSRTFTVPIVDNSVPQAPVSLLLVLATNNSSGTTLLVPTNASLTISDNDAGFAFATQTNTVRENAGFAVVGVVRVGPTNGTSQVQFTSHDGTAMAGVNYTAANSTLIFDPGQSAKSILVPLINDPRVTGDLIFTMTLSNPSPGAQVVAPSTNVIVLQDADAGLSFTNSAISVFKTSGSAVITVVCSNPSVEPVIVDTNTVPLSVNYTTVNGTATAGVDYLATSGLLIFTNGIGTNTFIVPILNNGQVTGDRAFSVILTNPTAPGKLVAPSNQVVTIRDGTAGFKFSKATYTTVKSAGQAIINVYRVGLTNSLASVVYTATNGTAIAGVHYTPTTGVLVFTNGVTNQTFSVAITDTSTVQPDETVLLQLFSPTNGVLLSPSAATLTIRDNSGSFVVPSGSALVSESGVGAPNGVIDSNETVTVLFAFRDAGGPDVTNLIATLLATNGVTAPSPVSQTYGPLILAGHSVSKPFSFTAQGTNGQQIVATFQLKDGLLNIGTGVFGYILGTRTITFSNTTPIVINDNTAASPYPSSININGLVGSVVKATVTVTNLNHHAPRDIEALVVAPNQANSLLMAHAGGLNAITNVTIKFDDAAATYLPQSTKINSGTNKPTIYTPVSTFAP
jgi:hypothetical protein